MENTKVPTLSPTAVEHASRPRNVGPLSGFNGWARVTGPCGDTMEFWVVVRDGKVAKAAFVTDGCGPSVASGSVATSLAEGVRVDEAVAIGQREILEALGGLPEEWEHCALLAADTLRAACESFLARTREPGCAAAERKPGEDEKQFEERRKLESRLSRIRHKVVVLSGKGGVGKSTVAVNLAVSLRMSGKRVGLLDVDVHGPSVPTMLGLEGSVVRGQGGELIPVDLDGLKVLSLGFFLNSADDAVIWRGPMKMGAIRQLLADAAWGDLDWLVVDSPPGTGDEPLSVVQLVGKLDGAVIVTTPQKVAAVDVRKSITFCRKLGVPILGVVENMNGFSCPRCGEVTSILSAGGGRRIAEDMRVPFLGSLPIDPRIAEACDGGRAFVREFATSPTAVNLREIFRPIEALDEAGGAEAVATTAVVGEDGLMKIAVPIADGKLASHFGHCERFALIECDLEAKRIVTRLDVDAPPHEPGLLPRWLRDRGAGVVIAGGMGQRALSLFDQQGIRVVVGAPAESPEKLALDFLTGALREGRNVCDH